MGIDGLNKLLKDKSSNSITRYRGSQLSGFRIICEMGVVMHRYMATTFNEVVDQSDIITYGIDDKLIFSKWTQKIIISLSRFLRCGIVPVLVFDGPPCAAKLATLVKRHTTKNNRREEARELLSQLRQKDIMAVSPKELKELRLAWRNCHSVTSDHITQLMDVCKCLGFPVMQAKHDAEKLCASLCIEGVGLGTYTTDTDTYVFGSPWVFTSIKPIDDDLILEARHLPTILQDLELSQADFVDVCILAGCDYNFKYPGYRTSSTTAFKMIKKFGNHSSMPDKYHHEDLNVDECRQIFAYTPSTEFIIDDYVFDIDVKRITKISEEIMTFHGLLDYMQMIVPLMQSLSPASSVPFTPQLIYVPPAPQPGFTLIINTSSDEYPVAASSNSNMQSITDNESNTQLTSCDPEINTNFTCTYNHYDAASSSSSSSSSCNESSMFIVMNHSTM